MKHSVNFKNKDGNKVGSMTLLKNENEVASLFFYGDIVDEKWETEYYEESVCPKNIIELLNNINEDEPVNIYINSCGGSVYGGTAIYNLIKRHKGTKNVIIDGIAASIASVIAMAGDTITMLKGSTLMVHKPMMYQYGYCNADKFRHYAEALDVLEENILSIYESKLKNKEDIEKIREFVDNETYLTADNAAEYFDIIVDTTAESVINKLIDFNEGVKEPEKPSNAIVVDEAEKERMLLELM